MGEAISTTAINLTWTDRSTNETGFKIERKLVGGNFEVVGTTNADIATFSDTGLTPATNYIYRVYSYNAAGNSPTYTFELPLTTTALFPTVTTTAATSISAISATSGGTITDDGGATITARGVVYSTLPNPTIALSTKTNDGTGMGSFISAMTGLNATTTFNSTSTYYVRAYATNSAGTAYGAELSFTIINRIVSIITIGSQTWTTTNLDVTTYSDGTIIPQVADPIEWAKLTTGAWCYYNNDPANGDVYGRMYNWYAVAGIWNEASKTDINQRKKLVPLGYHIPSDTEWTSLYNYLGGASVAGGKMKEAGSAHWLSPNTGTNSSGFTALPGSFRRPDGSFDYIGSHADWWSSSEINMTLAQAHCLNGYGSNFALSSDFDKRGGISVRCLKD